MLWVTATCSALCIIFSLCYATVYDYCDVVWSPTAAKLNCLIERAHPKFLNKLPLAYRSRFSFTLTEQRRFYMAIQILNSLHQISHKTFQFSRDVTGHLSHNFNRLFVPAETKAEIPNSFINKRVQNKSQVSLANNLKFRLLLYKQ